MPVPAVYKSGRCFYYKMVVDGVRKNFKAPGHNRAEAQKFVNQLYGGKKKAKTETTFADVLHLFADPELNPKLKDARITGHQYTMRYARMLASYVERLELFMRQYSPSFYKAPIDALNRKDCKDLMYTMVERLGITYLAMKYWKVVKMVMSYAADESLAPSNPAQGLHDIKPQKKRTIHPIEIPDMARILSGEYYGCDYDKDLVTLLACTGMRIGELAALTARQYQGGILIIDQAYKDENFKEIGSPKWGYSRTIPLCRQAREAIERRIREADSTQIFGEHPSAWYNRIIHLAMARCMLEDGWASRESLEHVSAHVFRHTLNTNLRIAGTIPDSIIAEYLSWQHQPENSVQKGYTHFYASSLKCVADLIDQMYESPPQGQAAEGKGYNTSGLRSN